jgi:hypothetical protein
MWNFDTENVIIFKTMISSKFDFVIQSDLLIIINRSEDNYKLVWSLRLIYAMQYYLTSFVERNYRNWT